MKSTGGRPRVVTDAQVGAILKWHQEVERLRELAASVKTLRELAEELGLPRGTVAEVIKRAGQYKQPSPEQRDAEISRRKRRIARLRQNGFM